MIFSRVSVQFLTLLNLCLCESVKIQKTFLFFFTNTHPRNPGVYIHHWIGLQTGHYHYVLTSNLQVHFKS